LRCAYAHIDAGFAVYGSKTSIDSMEPFTSALRVSKQKTGVREQRLSQLSGGLCYEE
jgi:hypothetical protein